jgi:hypothetical protein
MNTTVGPDLAKVYLDAAYASVRWEADTQRVVTEWKAWARSDEFRAVMETTLRAIRENDALRFLLDTRNAKLVLPEDERWIQEDLLPRFGTTGLRWTAIVIPANQLAQAILGDLMKTSPSGAIQRGQFGTLTEAHEWLTSRRVARDAAS